jgi:hypothetical protein
MAICDDAISLAWMLQVTSTTAFASPTNRSASASLNPRGSASRLAVALIDSLFLRFASDEMIAMIMSSPSVVFPNV